MKKVFKTKTYLKDWGGTCRVTAIVTDENGYLSITGEIIPPRCRTPHGGGCCHEEISKAFPKLRKLIPFHLCDITTGFGSYATQNASHWLLNGRIDYAKNMLHATDEEIRELKALCDYGLCVTKWCNSFNQITGQSQECFANAVEKMGIPQRVERQMRELMEYIETL